VWGDFFNGHPSPEADMLARLLRGDGDVATCGLVIAEVFQGFRNEPAGLRQRFADMECLHARHPETYFAAADLYRNLRKRGVTVRSTIDCLLVCLAAERDAWVLAKDRDIARILASGLVTARPLPMA
jgi:predicted nucleic acid-binding protein